MTRAALNRLGLPCLLALCACGRSPVDDPGNLPQLGEWEISRMAVSLRHNGASASTADHDRLYLASGAMPADSRSDCTEPRLADAQWLARQIGRQLDRSCKITQAFANGASVQGTGVCGEAERDSRPTETSFRYSAEATADRFTADADVYIRASLATGGSDATGMTVKISGERKGECGADQPAGTFRVR